MHCSEDSYFEYFDHEGDEYYFEAKAETYITDDELFNLINITYYISYVEGDFTKFY
jgi:hypothetical protein